MFFDAVIAPVTCFAAFLLRFEGDFYAETRWTDNFTHTIIYLTLISLAVFIVLGLYRSLWEFASVNELVRIVLACAMITVFSALFGFAIERRLPWSIYIIWFLLLTIAIGGSRMSFRIYRRLRYGMIWGMKSPQNNNRKRIMIIGAGSAGSAAIIELGNNSGVEVVCAVDDDRNKIGMLINGIRVMGTREDIPKLVTEQNIDEIIVAIPTAQRKEQAAILDICKTTGAKMRLLPSAAEIVGGQVTVSSIRDVAIEDLLGREVVSLNIDKARLVDKTVLVTGGGGSIGSELCRQISRLGPAKLIIFDIYENNMYMLKRELSESVEIIALVGSVRDTKRLDWVFEKYRPNVVFHAAAHKHVPTMEVSPCEGIKNNIFGTFNTASAAIKYGAERFIFVSTDKAVNPTNVMGATKRMAEMVIQALSKKQKDTLLAAVRFGNVLDSAGSVIPIWRQQIQNGGPVTLTHLEVTRFFMTIPEAARLVIQAGALANGGEVFVLDMGEPVKILELAHDMIRLSGFKPDEDILIEITGLRPGEKLYEELLLSEEGITTTTHEKIFVAKPSDINFEMLSPQLDTLREAAEREDAEKTVGLLKKYVKWADLPR
jgi:FlaA1/EpsC-like NDP-sugar epimerase